MPLQPEAENSYIQLALEHSAMLCSEAPPEILEACASEAEPTKFMEAFFATGYSQWVLENRGHRLPQEIINNAILVLWLRACRLHTSILLEEQEPDWDKPFFSDTGLYGEF